MQYEKQIDGAVEKYADMGIQQLLNIAGGGEKIVINNNIRKAAKERIYALINKRIAIPYNKEFTKQENVLLLQTQSIMNNCVQRELGRNSR